MKKEDFALMNKFRIKGHQDVYEIRVGSIWSTKNENGMFEAFYLPPALTAVTFHKSTMILGKFSSTEINVPFSEMELVEKFGLFSEELPCP